MRIGLIQFLLLVAALIAGMDTPAMALGNGPDIDGHHHAFVEVSDVAAGEDHPSSTGSGSELPHHHHCPTGLVADELDASASSFAPRDIHLPRPAAALASRATAPPTQPPAA
ncbi:hypothetical protein [Sphingopyxis sp. KK2]|uniref:hypothetical protein n=1 Tax=Sphingopyxis sp. KK2 TaxID=1855727 RepID=UPI001181C5F5|nr:hypothetical protein [Sphingopyxis sp. KK2]